jgi:hypothetical protein
MKIIIILGWHRHCYRLDEKFSKMGRLVDRYFEFHRICRGPSRVDLSYLDVSFKWLAFVKLPQIQTTTS